jgi:hypothetical protein
MNAGEQFVATVIGIFLLSINRPGSQFQGDMNLMNIKFEGMNSFRNEVIL